MPVVMVAWDGQLLARLATLGERITAHVQAGRLDRALAAGASPESSAAMALRASRLVSPAHQAALAASIRRVLDEVTGLPPRPGCSSVPVVRRSVRGSAEVLRELLTRLCGPGPLPVAGVARVTVLLEDGAGPLYRPGCQTQLQDAALHALAGLDDPPA
jgi:hypothetical protein